MIKSKKYKNHYMSKYKYQTTYARERKSPGQGKRSGGGTYLGEDKARKALERKLNRRLHQDTKARTKGGNWAFMEPI